MNALDERDYREKNNWRRWVWNRIAEKLPVPPQVAKVVYLAAAENLDAAVARQKGFKDYNLVPVDRDTKKVRTLRGAGALCIEDDAFAVANNFARPLHVVYFDFCSGMHIGICDNFVRLLFRAHVRDAVIAVNFLRGRDASSNLQRRWITETPVPMDVPSELVKHRGLLFYNLMTCRIQNAFKAKYIDKGVLDWVHQKMMDNITEKNISATQYRSSTNQTFDTCVFVNPLAGGWLGGEGPCLELETSDTDTRRKLAAFRAHQNMRYGVMS
jgi:hypothetical protein